MAHASARSIALAALSEWQHSSRFADSIMQEALANCPLGTPDRGFAHELFNGVLRNLTLHFSVIERADIKVKILKCFRAHPGLLRH